MSYLKTKAVLATAMLSVGGLASAAPIADEGLFFTAWNGDSNAASSIVINLGELTPAFRATATAPRALSGDSLTALTNWLGSLADLSTVQWGVVGRSEGDGLSSPPSPLYGGLTTSTNIETQFPSWGLFGGLDQFKLNVTNFRNIVNQNLQSTDAFAANNPNQLFGVSFDGGPDIASLGALGAAMPFYAFFGDQDGNEFFEGDFSKFAGTWKLDFAPGTGAALTYAPVPLPAAVWLLGTALAGMAGVARRRA